ncbi:hypothetical protein G6F57_019750 [Rhizopus arrhizus]|nr:hypothetical protein G6F57_019750 [Rhizopus arrhizus]
MRLVQLFPQLGRVPRTHRPEPEGPVLRKPAGASAEGRRAAVVGGVSQYEPDGAGAHADRWRRRHRAVARHHRIPGRNPSPGAAAAGRRHWPRPGTRSGLGHCLRHAPAEQPARVEVPQAHAGRGRSRQERLVQALGASGAGSAGSATGAIQRHGPFLPRRHADHRRPVPGAASGQCAALRVRSLCDAHRGAH